MFSTSYVKFAGNSLLRCLRSKRKSEQAADEEMRRKGYDLENRNSQIEHLNDLISKTLVGLDTSLDIRVLNPK